VLKIALSPEIQSNLANGDNLSYGFFQSTFPQKRLKFADSEFFNIIGPKQTLGH